MTPSQLIETIERSGLVDARILAKIRRELDNPAKPVKPKAVIKFLVEKGELTAAQGEKFLAGKWQPPKQLQPEPGFEVRQPGAKADYDTDDLTNMEPDVAPAKTPPKPTPVVTPVDGTRVYDVNEAVEVIEELEVPVSVQPTVIYDPLQDGGFGMPANSPLDSPSLGSGGNDTASKVLEFAGKKNKTDQWATKWIYIGGAILAVLLVVGAVLTLSVFGEAPEKLLEASEKSYLGGNFLDAATKSKEFYEAYPGHAGANGARVREVQSLISHSYSMKSYKEVFAIAKEKLPTIEQLPAYDNIKEDFAIWFPTVALAASESVLNEKEKTIASMQAGLQKAEESGQLLDYLSGTQRNMDTVKVSLEKYENNLKTIRGLINKEVDYEKALKEIDELASQSKPDQAFEIFNRLTRTYGDLGARLPLREAMKKVTASEMNLIQPATIDVKVTSEEIVTAIERQITLVSKYGTPTSGLQDELLPYLIEGYLYMLSGLDGSVIWSRFVGFETMMRPIWVDAASKMELLAIDQRTHELIKLNAKTGQLVWRATIGESFLEPTIHGDAIFVATRSGLVLKLNLESGALETGVKLPKKIGVPVTAAEQDPYLYVVGENSNIYVLSSENLACQEIYYLGHMPNQVRIAPIYWSGHLLVDVNSQNSELTVFRLANKGTGLEYLQKVNLCEGAISLPPTRLGRNMLFVSDTGELRLIELTTAEEKTPISKTAEEKIDTRGASRAYVLAQGTGLWIASRGLAVFAVDKVKGQFRRDSIIEGADTFLSPLVRIDDVLIHVRRREGSRQISGTAANVADMKTLWRADFGAGLAGTPLVANDQVYAISSQGDGFVLDSGNTAKFSTIGQAMSASDIDVPLNFSSIISLGANKYGVLSKETPDFLSVDLGARKSVLSRLQSPADKLASQPQSLSQDFIFPSLSGLMVRLDENGRSIGAPFQPPLSPGETVKWNRPGVNEQDMILVGDEKQNVFLLNGKTRGTLD
ncbi:MAG: PQQ-binding-like beta-propeller repeat protein, partial [Pirellulaceae bacterium]